MKHKVLRLTFLMILILPGLLSAVPDFLANDLEDTIPELPNGFAKKLAYLRERAKSFPIKVSYVSYRPATCEEEALKEYENERRNLGGMVYIYLTNHSEETVSMRDWQLNGLESGNFKISNKVLWDRWSAKIIGPEETQVLEICGVTREFSNGKPFILSATNRKWRAATLKEGILTQDPVYISSIVFNTSLNQATVHLKNDGYEDFVVSDIMIEGYQVQELEITSNQLNAGSHIIADIRLQENISPGNYCIIKATLQRDGDTSTIYSHRRAYPDFFPIGTWGIRENQFADAKKHHLDTFVKGGKSTDPFFIDEYRKYNLKAIVHTGIYPDDKKITDLKDHPAIACWMIHDEPDWTTPAQMIFMSNEITKQIDSNTPTLITLCRNNRYFEYAPIPDIPCHDHYSVSAPTTSVWPYKYGTKLEETGYYTRDLKYATEPKPIWVWSQGLNIWSERPKMPLPTADELGAQLYFNLGQGAKGILWFVFSEEAGEKYPETKLALMKQNRMLSCFKDEILVSDPYGGNVAGPDKIDIAPLISKNMMLIFLTNKDYEINDTAYTWNVSTNPEFSIECPEWFNAKSCFEYDIDQGAKKLSYNIHVNQVSFKTDDISMGRIIIISTAQDAKEFIQNKYEEVLEKEKAIKSIDN